MDAAVPGSWRPRRGRSHIDNGAERAVAAVLGDLADAIVVARTVGCDERFGRGEGV